MRIIDADKIKKPIYAEEDNVTGFGMSYDEMCGYNDGIDDVFTAIRCTPTIDAVPVVRCKDCRYYDRTAMFNCEYAGWEERHDDDFCSYGAPKDEVSE